MDQPGTCCAAERVGGSLGGNSDQGPCDHISGVVRAARDLGEAHRCSSGVEPPSMLRERTRGGAGDCYAPRSMSRRK